MAFLKFFPEYPDFNQYSEGPFLHGPKKQKKGHSWISEEKMTKISDYVFYLGHFSTKEKYLLIIFCTF